MDDSELQAHINVCNPSDWPEFKQSVKGCVWIDACLLSHEDPAQITFVSHPGNSVRFDVNKCEIVTLIPHKEPLVYLAGHYKRVRIFLKKDALVQKRSYHLAQSLPPYIKELNEYLSYKLESTAWGPYDALSDDVSDSHANAQGDGHELERLTSGEPGTADLPGLPNERPAAGAVRSPRSRYHLKTQPPREPAVVNVM